MYSGYNSGYNSAPGGYSSGEGYNSGDGGYQSSPSQGYPPQQYNQPYPPSYNQPPPSSYPPNPYANQPGPAYPPNPYANQPGPAYPPSPYPNQPPISHPHVALPYYPPPSVPGHVVPSPAPIISAPVVPPPAPIISAPVVPPSTPIVSLPVSPQMMNQGIDRDCQILHAAMRGLGTDENAIINVICSRNTLQRAQIRKRYIALYGKDLIKKLKDELSGNFEDTVVGLFMTPPEYDAYCLYKAMKGIGTNEGVLIEIIGTRNNQEIQMIKAEFQRNYGKPLEKWVYDETSGHLRKLLISLLQANRSMNIVPNHVMCQNDAQALYVAGEGRWGTDESTFIRIFTQRSAAEIDLISRCYQQLRGKSLHHAVEKEFSGDTRKLLHTILEGLQDLPAYYAKRLRDAVEGIGTNDSRLVRVIVSRCEVALPLIKQAYGRLYGRDLVHDVRSDTSGDYKKILTYLLTRV